MRQASDTRKILGQLTALGVVLALGLAMRLSGLARNGFGNEYYSAGVFSMTRSLHNFAFNAFDPAGILAIDKPPVALWVQAAVARLFGFAPMSVLLPQVAEGMLAIVLLWYIVRRRHGAVAGLLAALLLAITPISVAVDRSSNTDSCLVLVLVLAAGVLIVAAERGSWRLLAAALALVGIGFNIKMMAAFVVLPGFALTYWLGAPMPGRRRVIHLAAGGLACVAVSLAWVGAVQLTPASDRPYVDSSATNSMLDLVLDHNGVQRFVPSGGFAAANPAAARRVPVGPFRLMDPRLASQAEWLAPLAIVGAGSVLADAPLLLPLAPAAIGIVLWLGWLLAYAAVYSAAGGLFSPYYLVTLAPALATLAAIGLVSLWTRWRAGRAGYWLLPLALVATALWQGWLMVPRTMSATAIDEVTAGDSGRAWLALIVLGGAAVSMLGLLMAPSPSESKAALTLGVLALLVAPASWAAETAFVLVQGARPVASLGDADQPGARRWGGATEDRHALAAYLEAQSTGAGYLAATSNARQAAPLIIATGAPVIALGGYQGSIPVMTLPALIRLADSGALRFVLLDEPGEGRGPEGRRFGRRPTALQKAIATWVRARGVPVDAALWRGPAEGGAQRSRMAAEQLYDLRSDLPSQPAPTQAAATAAAVQ